MLDRIEEYFLEAMDFLRTYLRVLDNPHGELGMISRSSGLDNSAICANFILVTFKEKTPVLRRGSDVQGRLAQQEKLHLGVPMRSDPIPKTEEVPAPAGCQQFSSAHLGFGCIMENAYSTCCN